jgi:hypothetical protein
MVEPDTMALFLGMIAGSVCLALGIMAGTFAAHYRGGKKGRDND